MAPIWLIMNLLIINKSLLCRYLWSDSNNFFTELFMRETSFIKRAIYGAHIGFTMSVCSSVRFSVLTASGETFYTKIGIGKLIFDIDVAKRCMFRNIW